MTQRLREFLFVQPGYGGVFRRSFIVTLAAMLAVSYHASGQQAEPLARHLNPDGTVNLDLSFSGSLDMRGWRMESSEAGAPRFVPVSDPQDMARPENVSPASTGDEFWDDQFNFPGMNNYVVALAMSGGYLYAGGWFTTAGDVNANYIARWDGTNWSDVGGGTNCYVYALTAIGTDIYAGGCFSTAGGVSASKIARWDGSNWSALGSGVSGGVECLATDGSNLFVGGTFGFAGVSANNIAKWDGSSWSALGSGVSNTVKSIVVNGGNVYAAGHFTTAGGSPAQYVARWDGTSWSGLGIGLNQPALALTTVGSDLYAGGAFTTAGGNPAIRVAKWDGSTWSALGGGIAGTVLSMASIGTDVYAGGQAGLMRWDGSSWSSAGSISGGVGSSSILALLADGSVLHAGGNFTSAGLVTAGYIASWSGTDWSSLGSGNGMGGIVRALAVMGNDLYAGGDFRGGMGLGGVNYIVRWNGSSGSALGTGMNGPVHALLPVDTILYAGGAFTAAGGGGANYVARWNGSGWSALGSGLNGNVYAIAGDGSDVYVGGLFTTAGGGSATYAARWDGSAWWALGTGTNDTVLALTVMGGDLYAGGSFTIAGGIGASHIARWDGLAWSALDSTPIPTVRSLQVKDGYLYAGGDGYVVRWDGSGWTWIYGPGRALASNATDLYGGGISSLGHWNGSMWSGLGSGTNGTVYALALLPDSAGGHDVYAGGSFTGAGGKASKNIARWNGPSFNVSSFRVDFGQVHVGTSKTDSVTVTNTGSPALEISSVGSYFGEFSASPQSASIASGDSQKFYITFTPTSAGSINSFMTFSDNMSPGYDLVRVSGTGGAPVFAVAPGLLFFGNVPPNTAKLDSFMVKNDGTEFLDIYSVLSSHPDLTVDPASATIAPSDTQYFYVQMSPSGEYLERRDTVTFAYNTSSSPAKLITWSTAWFTVVDTVQDGWNMVSLPSIVIDNHVSSVFQWGSPSVAFAYEGQYRATDTLRKGPGYWIKFTGDWVEYIYGAFNDRETVEVKQGWNMVGSISFPVSVEGIGSIPGGIVTSNFFGYHDGYFVADSIMPGNGYWVKSSQAGALVLAVPPPAASHAQGGSIRIVPSAELPPEPPGSQSQSLVPGSLSLEQNYPNPFNPETLIRYTLPGESRVTLKIYSVLGEEVATLVDEVQGPGSKAVHWDAGRFTSGVYYCRLHAGGGEATRKLVLLK